MAFDVKYHIQAEDELKRRKKANEKELEIRQNRVEQHFPEIAEQRSVMARTGVKLIQLALGGGGASADTEKVEAQLAQIQQEHTAAAARIKELLMKAKYPHDYLNPIYSCEVCKDSGIVRDGRCDCYKKTVSRLAAQEVNSKSPLTLTGFESFDVSLYPDIIEDGHSIRTIMQGNFDCCRDYAEDFHLPDSGLLLSGKTGLGKTHLSLAIAGKVLEKGFNAVYGSAPDLFRKIESEHFGREEGSTMESLQSAELLVLDDIGAEWESSFYTATFYNLLNSRMNLGNPTLINTNLTMAELKSRYGERIMSRFLTMKILKFYGNDIRQIKRGL